MNTTDLLKKLVKIESHSGQEEKLADFIVGWAKDHGLPVEKQSEMCSLSLSENHLRL